MASGSVRLGGGGAKCKVCDKTVYVAEAVTLEGNQYHANCMKCSECNTKISPTNCAMYQGTMFCKPHFKQLFKLRGKYDDLTPSSPVRASFNASKEEAKAAIESVARAAAAEADPELDNEPIAE